MQGSLGVGVAGECGRCGDGGGPPHGEASELSNALV